MKKKIFRVYSKSNSKHSEVRFFIMVVMPDLDILSTFLTKSVVKTASNHKVIIIITLIQDSTYKFANH